MMVRSWKRYVIFWTNSSHFNPWKLPGWRPWKARTSQHPTKYEQSQLHYRDYWCPTTRRSGSPGLRNSENQARRAQGIINESRLVHSADTDLSGRTWPILNLGSRTSRVIFKNVHVLFFTRYLVRRVRREKYAVLVRKSRSISSKNRGALCLRIEGHFFFRSLSIDMEWPSQISWISAVLRCKCCIEKQYINDRIDMYRRHSANSAELDFVTLPTAPQNFLLWYWSGRSLQVSLKARSIELESLVRKTRWARREGNSLNRSFRI